MAYVNEMTLCAIFLVFTIVASSELKNPDITSLHILSDIKYRFSTTLVTSKVANRENSSVEAKFEVTLPDAAFITDFVMEIDGVLYPGEINEKEKAKKKYEDAKKKGQSAGHVSQKPRHTNRFSVEVNVAALSSVTFNLTYQELLERVYGEYEHIIYIDPGQIVKDFQIRVSILESKKISKVSVPPIRNDIIQDSSVEEGTNALVTIDRPTPNSADIRYAPTQLDQQQQSDQGISGLFVVEYDIERQKDAGEVMVVDGYFIHYFAPEGIETLPQDVLFVLDVSGSMYGNKIKQQREAMDKILQDLNEGDRFNIMEFSSKSSLWKNQLIPASKDNKAEARAHTKKMTATGGTRINDALLEGISILNKQESDEPRMKMIVFLTDGMGEVPRDTTLKNVKKANMKETAIFSLAFGNNADYAFVKKLALANNGIARKIYEDADASLQIKGFYDEISTSALQNVTFEYLGNNENIAENITKMNFNTFFNGKELVVAGKLTDNDIETVELIVTGDGASGSIELKLESDIKNTMPDLTNVDDLGGIVERIWAYLTIKQLLDEAIGAETTDEKNKLNDKALELSLQYKFVTPLTSMVVTKPEEKDVGSFEEDTDSQLAAAGYAGRQGIPMAQYSSRPFNLPGPAGQSFAGGAAGDPHFMVRITGLELPICFNIDTHSGDVIRMLEDPVSGVTINAGMISSPVKNTHGDFKTFIGVLVVFTPSVKIEITPYNILFNGVSLSWDDLDLFQMSVVDIIIRKSGTHDRTMSISIDDNIVVKVRRHMKEGTHMAMSYLNMNIDKETGISSLASGVLGELVHKTTKLIKVSSDVKGHQHGHFLEDGDGHRFHFYSTLAEIPDLLTGEMTKCWNTHELGKGLLENTIENYFITDINSVN